jgi:hypothetical protein
MGGLLIFTDEVRQVQGNDPTDADQLLALAEEANEQYLAMFF